MTTVRRIRHRAIDKEIYDRRVEQSPQGVVYAMSWYLDVVSPGWELLVSGDYECVMPLPLKRRYGIPYAVQPPLCQQLGVFSHDRLTQETIDAFVKRIPVFYYNLQFNAGNHFGRPDAALLQTNYCLDLNRPYEAIRSEYKKNNLRNILKGEKERLVANRFTERQTYIDILFANAANRPILQMKETLLRLLERSEERSAAEIWHVEDASGSVLSCAFFLYWRNKSYYMVPVSTEEGKQKRSMFFLIDSFVRFHAQSERILDFEGSSIPNLARFYEGFGAVAETYPRLKGRAFMNYESKIGNLLLRH